MPAPPKTRAFLRIAGALVVLALIVSGALAHSGATGIVKQRMDMMSDIARLTKLIGQMVKRETAFDAAQIEKAALSLREHARMVPDMFPEGSTQTPTEALPVIWTDWPGFAAANADFEAAASDLAKAAATGDEKTITARFAAMGRTCGACHERFRLKK